MDQTIGQILKRICLAAWFAVLLICICVYLYDPARFNSENIAAFLLLHGNKVLALYIGLSVIRGFTLLPSTPLVIAGTLVFPETPGLVLAISIGGILVSSTTLYYFSELMGFRGFFEGKRPDQVRRIRHQMEKPHGLIFVFLWAFFPLVPTDAVCYVAGTIRMKFWRFIGAVFLGELILCTIYVYSGRSIIQNLLS